MLYLLPPDELRINAFRETEIYRLGKMELDKNLCNPHHYWAALTITGTLLLNEWTP